MKKTFFAALLMLLSLVRVWAGEAPQPTATVTSNPGSYQEAAGEVTFTVNLNFPTTASVVSFSAAPSGAMWQYVGSGGGINFQASPRGHGVPTDPDPDYPGDTTDPTDPRTAFSWAFLNSSALGGHATFTFTLKYPAGLTGQHSFAFSAIYRVNGGTDVAFAQIQPVVISTFVPPVRAIASIPFKVLTAGASAVDFKPVSGADGVPPYTYLATTTLPAGLSINASTGNISGFPEAGTMAADYTITVRDSTMATATAKFNLTVNPPLVATVQTSSVNLPNGVQVTPFKPVTATGGTGALTYAISPSLPTGLAFNLDTGEITGTPTVDRAMGSYMVSVRDTLNGFASKIFNLAVVSVFAKVPNASTSSKTNTVGANWEAFTTLAVVGGTQPYRWTISPALSAGLSFDTTTGRVSGTPTVTKVGRTYTYVVKAFDATDAELSHDLTLIINEKPVLAIAAPKVMKLNVADSYTPVTVTEGTSPFTFAVSPALPTGLTLNANTGVISGTPTVITTGAGTRTMTVTDLAGVAVTGDFQLRVSSLPVIDPQPVAPAPVAVGGTLALSVTATGTPAPTYQWLRNGEDISAMANASAATATLTIPSVKLTDRGSYRVRVTNEAGSTLSNIVTPTIFQHVKINTPPTAQSVIVGQNATFTVGAEGDPIIYQWFRNGVEVPGASTATLTLQNVGINGGGDITVRVRNDFGNATSTAVLLTVNPPAPVFAANLAPSATAVQDRVFSFPVAVNTTFKATFSATGLDAVGGLEIDQANGTIGGRPTNTGTFPIVITVTNPTSSATFNLSLKVNPPPPVFTSPVAVTRQSGAAFTFSVTASGTPTPTFTATGLDAIGLSIASNGAISGTPTKTGTFTAQITATNTGGSVTQPLVITLTAPPNAPVYAGPLNPSFNAGTITFTPSFTGASSPLELVSGELPSGLRFEAGSITGTTTAIGSFALTFKATNAGGSTTVVLTLVVNPNPSAPRITNTITTITGRQWTGLDNGGTFQVEAAGAAPAVTAFTALGLPNGLAISSTGVISGVPTVFGTFTTIIRAKNALGDGPPATFTFILTPHPDAPTIVSSPIARFQVGSNAFTYSVVTDKESNLYKVATDSPALPAGLTLNESTGVISGTPEAGTAGQTRVWLYASKGSIYGPSAEILVIVAPAANVPVVQGNGTAFGQVGQSFQYRITASSATMITSYRATYTNAMGATVAVGDVNGDGSAEIFLRIDPATGILTGVPSTPTTTPIALSLTATNADGASRPKTLLITITPPPATPAITSSLAASGRVGQLFSYQIDASEGATAYSAAGLPDGLALDSVSGRTITGTPTVSGTFSVALRAANAAGLGKLSTLVLSIAPAPAAPTISSAASTDSKRIGESLSYQITATSETQILSYAVMEGDTTFTRLPAGLSFNSSSGLMSGVLAGTPGLYTVRITASNASGASFPQPLTINVRPSATMPVINSGFYVTGRVNEDFSYTIGATNIAPLVGDASYTLPISFDVVGLPDGLAVNSAKGTIVGRPTNVGTTVVSLVATNASGSSPTRDLTITVLAAANAPVVGGVTLARGQVDKPFTYQIEASGTPSSYEVLDAPSWVSFNGSGGITGTPTEPGSITVLVIATNSAGSSEPVPVTFEIAPAADTPVIISSRRLDNPTLYKVGVNFTYTTQISSATAAFTPLKFTASGLPDGLAINESSGVISGKPKASGTFVVKITPSNSKGVGATVDITIKIAPSVTF